MRAKLITRIAILLLLTGILCFSACDYTVQLAIPQTLSIKDNMLEWEAVPFASGYEISIDEEIFTSAFPYYDLDALDAGSYTIKVRTIGEGNYLSSVFSEEIIFEKTDSGGDNGSLKRLPTPTITVIDGVGVLIWRTVTGAAGYRIYINNVIIYTVNAGNINTYTLDIDEPGTYSVEVQAIADPIKNLDSNKSSSYSYIIDSSGKPHLPMLSKPAIGYDAERKALCWQRNPIAEGYVVNYNGEVLSETIFQTIGNYIYYSLELEAEADIKIKAKGDGEAYDDSAYSNTISFPIEVTMPPKGIEVGIVNESNEVALVFEETEYSIGYRVAFNGAEYDITDNYFVIDALSVPDGCYLIKVKSLGDDVYYTTSPYSAEIIVCVVSGNLILNISTPDTFLFEEGRLEWQEVEHSVSYSVAITDLALPDSREEFTAADNYFVFGSEYAGDYIVSVKALAEAPYSDSLWSVEYPVRFSAAKPSLPAPADLKYTGEGFEWLSASEDGLYLLILDGTEIFVEGEHYPCDLTAGRHIAKIKAVASSIDYYDSVFTEEIAFYAPIRLNTPEPKLFNGVLSYEMIENAANYRIYSNGEIIADKVYSLYYDLKSAITVDGIYYISVQAVGEAPYSASPRSIELIYAKTDSDYGTEAKPIVIKTVQDFINITTAPDGYYVINSTLLDFAVGGEKRSWEPLFDNLMPFRGVIIGGGCVIKNINLIEKNGISGIFGVLFGARIQGLIFSDITLTGTLEGSSAGLLCSRMIDTEISFVNISAVIDVTGPQNIGTIAGSAEGIITNCNLYIDMTAAGDGIFVGGAAGVMYGDIINTTIFKQNTLDTLLVTGNGVTVGAATAAFYGNATGISSNIAIVSEGDDYKAGGLFGIAEGLLDKCAFYGSIVYLGEGNSYIAGVSAIFRGVISDIALEAVADIQAEILYFGGIVAYADIEGEITGVTVDNLDIELTATSFTAGGIFALGKFASINDFDVTISADIEGSGSLGGVAGISETEISSGVVNATICAQGRALSVGGVAGVHSGNLSDIDLNVSISAAAEGDHLLIGGAVGSISGNISDLAVIGNMVLTGDNFKAGGVAAVAEGDISVEVGSIEASFSVTSSGSGIAGGVAGELMGSLIAEIYVDLNCGTGVIGGAVAVLEGNAELNIISEISASGGITGGAVGIFEGELDGSVQSVMALSGDITAGGAAGESAGVFSIDVSADITVTDGGEIKVGGISGRDSLGISGTVAVTLDIAGTSGYAGGAVGYGEGVYDINVTGNINIAQSGTEEICIGGIAGYARMLQGSFEGALDAECVNLLIGGAAGRVINVSEITVNADISGSADTLYAGAAAAVAETAYSCSVESSSLVLEAHTAYIGMFGEVGYINECAVTDLAIQISAEDVYCGLLAGSADSIEFSSVGTAETPASLTLMLHDGHIGGAVGVAASNGRLSDIEIFILIDIQSDGEIIAGGVAGTGGAYKNAFAQADITVNAVSLAVGGIASELTSAETSYFAGKITADAESLVAGGFLASGDTEINNCYTSAHLVLEGDTVSGGLFAANITGRISYSYTTGSIYSSGSIDETDYSNAELVYAYTDCLAVLAGGSGIVEKLGYGRTVSEGFGYNWELNADCYPVLKELNGQNGTASASTLAPFAIVLDGAVTDFLPYAASDSGIFDMLTWESSDESVIRIINGNLYCYNAGEVELKGYISGGAEAVDVIVTVTGDNIAGTGTELDPYIIDSIKWLHYLDNFKSAWFEITADISLYGYDIFPIGSSAEPFTGRIQGNGHILSGLRLSGSSSEAGFFACIQNAEISSLRFENSVFKLEIVDYAGILAAKAINSTVNDVTAQGSFSVANALYAGGLIGEATDSVINGLGFNGSMNIINCGVAGGLIGGVLGTEITNSYVNMSLFALGSVCYGGLIGAFDNDSIISVSYVATVGELSVEACVGAFAYAAYGDAADCYALFESRSGVVGAFAYIGGGSYTDCYGVKSTFGVQTAVIEGSGEGITVCAVTDALGSAMFSDSEWTVSVGALPRLADAEGQSGIVEPIFEALSISICDTDTFDLSKLILFESGCFGAALMESSNTELLYFDASGYAKILDNIEAGELTVYFSFEGGYRIGVEIIADISENPDFEGGYGTELAPYRIKTAEQFNKISDYSYAYFVLENDITLDESYVKGDFAGYLSGNGFMLNVSGGGLFITATGTVSGLEIIADITESGNFVAALAETSDNLIVSDIDITYVIDVSGVSYVGGLVAYARRTVFDDIRLNGCSITASGVSVTAGGVAGYFFESLIDRIYFIENITGTVAVEIDCNNGYAGGIVGYSELPVANIDIFTNVSIQGEDFIYAGGIAGVLSDCHSVFVENSIISALGEIAAVYSGGIAGKAENLTECFVISTDVFAELAVEDKYISSEDYGACLVYAGGVAGIANLADIVSFTDSRLIVNVLATDLTGDENLLIFAGGIIGESDRLKNAYTDSIINTNIHGGNNGGQDELSVYAGGLAGAAYLIENVSAEGRLAVTAAEGASGYAGGIVGLIAGEYFEYCAVAFASSRTVITLTDAVGGGIAGKNETAYLVHEHEGEEEPLLLPLFINCYYDNELFNQAIFGIGNLEEGSYLNAEGLLSEEITDIAIYPESLLVLEHEGNEFYMDCWNREVWSISDGNLPYFDGRLL